MNVTTYNAGKVHRQHPGVKEAFPICRSGGQNQRGTQYFTTQAPVTCKTCQTYTEEPTAAAEKTEEAAPVKKAKPIKLEGTCHHCNTRCTNTGRYGNWKHDKQQADKHRAHPTGTLRQI